MKKLLLSLSVILLISLHSQAQTKETPGAGGGNAIMRFYPNPATTTVTFDFQRNYEKGYSLQIYSFLGPRKMYEQPNVAEKVTVNLSDYTRGVYIYQLRDKTGKLVESGKFQVSK
ncbi:MAG TPA: T9SS type A sorting domain-containing protein [Flavisolibacter sp.]|nr:T9SS type A sorting domain-containing protein [Flavisolibacter sp.]